MSTKILVFKKSSDWFTRILLAIAIFVALPAQKVRADLLVGDYDGVRAYSERSGDFIDLLVTPGSGGVENITGMAFGPDLNLYVAAFATGAVLRYSGKTGAFIDVFVPPHSGGLGAPNDVTFGPDGNLYVADGFYGTNSILRYNGKTGSFLGVFASGGGIQNPESITFGSDGNLFVGNATSSDVLRYHGDSGRPFPATGKSGASFVSGSQGGFNTIVAFDAEGHLYVGSGASPDILRYNGNEGTFLGSFASNAATGRFRFGPDGDLYVANYLAQSVSKYSGSTGAFVKVLVSPGSGGLGRAQGLVFTPYSPHLSLSKVPNRSGPYPLEGELLVGNAYIFTTPDTGVAQVEFKLDGAYVRTEKYTPFDFASTAADGSAAPFNTSVLPPGSHSITARVTRNDGTVQTASGSFSVPGLYLSDSPTRSNPVVLNGRTVSAGNIYVFTTPDTGVARVQFWLDGALVKTENLAPYDFAGTAGDGTALPFNAAKLAKGAHVIGAHVTTNDGSVLKLNATFYR